MADAPDAPQQEPVPPQPTGMSPKDEHMWGMLCHLTALVAYVGVPFGHILGPLVVWLIKREQSSFVDDQGKEALNFQISITIYGLVAAVLTLVIIGIFLGIALVIFDLVMVIIASVKANRGERYRYPLTIRFLK